MRLDAERKAALHSLGEKKRFCVSWTLSASGIRRTVHADIRFGSYQALRCLEFVTQSGRIPQDQNSSLLADFFGGKCSERVSLAETPLCKTGLAIDFLG